MYKHAYVYYPEIKIYSISLFWKADGEGWMESGGKSLSFQTEKSWEIPFTTIQFMIMHFLYLPVLWE